jgi:hypothetical protein
LGLDGGQAVTNVLVNTSITGQIGQIRLIPDLAQKVEPLLEDSSYCQENQSSEANLSGGKEAAEKHRFRREYPKERSSGAKAPLILLALCGG